MKGPPAVASGGKAAAAAAPSPGIISRWNHACTMLCMLLATVLLLQQQGQRAPALSSLSSLNTTQRLAEAIVPAAAAADAWPQGSDPALWPADARTFIQQLEAILARYYAAEMPFKDPSKTNNNKQKYIQIHLPRFMHSLIRARPHIQRGARIVALGEKGHVPALLHELFAPSMLKVTTTEYPGVMTFRDASSNKSIDVELVQHNAETEPLPFASNSVDNIFFLEVLEHLTMDPMFALLEMHRVLKDNGTLFLSTPNLGSFSSLARLNDGWAPYSFSKYLSNRDGEGNITHVREYSWKELERYLQVAGFDPQLASFSMYAGDAQFWDFGRRAPAPAYARVFEALPLATQAQSLNVLGSTAFLIARKARVPDERRPWQLYAYATEFKFEGYPVCRNASTAHLCRDKQGNSSSSSSSSGGGASRGGGASSGGGAAKVAPVAGAGSSGGGSRREGAGHGSRGTTRSRTRAVRRHERQKAVDRRDR